MYGSAERPTDAERAAAVLAANSSRQHGAATMPPSPRPTRQLNVEAVSASPPELVDNLPPAVPPGSAASDHAPERLAALAASRADAYKLEVEELRVSLAKQQRRQSQMMEEHSAQVAALTAELEARGRGEMLARTRCEAVEIELRACRQQLAKAREAAKRNAGTRQEELGTEMLAKISSAMRGLACHGFKASVLSWRKRALRSGIAQWAANAQLLEASEVEAEAQVVIEQANSFARAEAKASNSASPEAWLREVQRNARVSRLANYFESLRRHDLLAFVHLWRIASCALAAEEDLTDVAGRLKAAQAGMVKVLDGRAASEEVSLRQAALARCIVGAASLHGVRRERRERHHSLQMGFKPWVCMVMSVRLTRMAAMREELADARENDAHSARRADALTRELQSVRNNLAASQKRVREAQQAAETAAEQASKSDEVKQRSEALSKLARGKAEDLERQKYAIAAKARNERQQVLTMRRGVVALALRTALRRESDLSLARCMALWAAVVAILPDGILPGDDEGSGRAVRPAPSARPRWPRPPRPPRPAAPAALSAAAARARRAPGSLSPRQSSHGVAAAPATETASTTKRARSTPSTRRTRAHRWRAWPWPPCSTTTTAATSCAGRRCRPPGRQPHLPRRVLPRRRALLRRAAPLSRLGGRPRRSGCRATSRRATPPRAPVRRPPCKAVAPQAARPGLARQVI